MHSVLAIITFLYDKNKSIMLQILYIRARTGAIHSIKISGRSSQEKWSFFLETFQLDQTDPFSFGQTLREILVKWIAPIYMPNAPTKLRGIFFFI